MIIDERDGDRRKEIEELGMGVLVTDTIMSSLKKKISLSRAVLKALELST
jgi:hypothetical protein